MGRPAKKEQFLIDKYHEITWALHLQGYNFQAIGRILNRSRSVIMHVVKKMPADWQTKWKKVE